MDEGTADAPDMQAQRRLLSDAFGTRPGDLLANQGGRIGPGQAAYLARHLEAAERGARLGMIAGGVFIAVGALVAGIGALVDGSAQRAAVVIGTGAVVLGIALILSGPFQRRAGRRMAALAGGSVESVAGPATRDDSPGVRQAGRRYLVTIGTTTFTVTRDQHHAFRDGAAYRVWFVRYRDVPLAIGAEPD